MDADVSRAWLATCPRGIAPLLARELADLGATEIGESESAVSFTGRRAVMYRACLWSRVANRVLLPVTSGPAHDSDALYDTVLAAPWDALIAPGATIAVSFSGTNATLRNTRFGAQRCKDAILDSCRAAGAAPPRVDPKKPDLLVSVRLQGSTVDVALDLVGDSLHRRGYRVAAGEAPLKENLAAALLLRAGWPGVADGEALIDPMCGAATLLLEGALMALDRAPSLGRQRWGFRGWRGHEAAQWDAIVAEARARAERAMAGDLPEIRGYDADPRVVRSAQENIAAAGLDRVVRVSVKSLNEVRRPTHRPLPRGLVICNPPYGERLGQRDALPLLYRRLGELLHAEFNGWQAAILAPDRELGHALGLRSHRQYAFLNGRIPVSLLLLDLTANRLADAQPAGGPRQEGADPAPAQVSDTAVAQAPADAADPGAAMFANRLRKNQRRLAKWLRGAATDSYRLYDADMPEYTVAVDRYGDWLHVAEYRAPASIDPADAAARLSDALAVLPQVTGVPPERIVVKRRERQRGSSQYGRQDTRRDLQAVTEGDVRLLVNLHDYLDTGLFLDHRPLRRRIGAEAKGRRFLNLFCYTGSATVHAAVAGARQTVSVDLSNTYLTWLGKNLALNGLAEGRHRRERADVAAWLKTTTAQFDVVLLDPPSFSNSRRVEEDFDVQRDHADLIDLAMARTAPAGVLYFSNNRRRFQLDPQVSDRYAVDDITRETLDPDFPRSPPPHRCWQIRHRGAP